MAVAVDKDVLTGQTRLRKFGRPRREKIGQKPHLIAEPFGSLVVGQQFQQFVLKHAGTAGLKEDERQPGINLRRHSMKNTLEVGTRSRQKSEVIEWPAAANVRGRRFDLESCRAEHGLSGDERLRMVVVIPGIGPKENLRCACS